MVDDLMDPFELLQELNPVDPADLRGVAFSPQAQDALEQILAGIRQPPRLSRKVRVPHFRRRTVALVLIPLAAAIATAAWALSQEASQQLTIGCYASADLEAHTVVVPAGDASPTSTCRVVWERRDFGTPTAPPLQACVLPSGAIGVFPSPDGQACNHLKLAPLEPNSSPPSTRTAGQPGSSAQLKNALVAKFLANRCMNQQQATSVVQTELRRLRLSGWQVRPNGVFINERPCAGLAFDEAHHAVFLVPMPKQP